MRSQGSTTRSRRGSRIAASAALVCLGAPLAAGCGGGGDDGYVAVGAADPSGRSGDGTGPVKPDDKVRMVPLPGDGDGTSKGDGSGNGGGDGGKPDGPTHGGNGEDDGDASRGAGGSAAAGTAGGPAGASGSAPLGGSGATGGSDGSADSGGSHGHSSTGGASGASGASPGSGTPGGGQQSGGGSSGPDAPSPPSGPAVLKASAPRRAEADDRWCEKVTVRFTNSGGRTVTGGKVTFRTHIIGALGIDWATRESTRALPVPIRAGEKKEKTWTVCVDAWRVPLGMHIETREVRLTGWK
ncbi:hypothetical protein [Streptomyces spirodelae]|uniref:Secreted protein n=1 Tax=Streptomyces spirodelae TaxID=2812904 RepID=A0ABS3X0E2_9ACTN|nr:hypothetical protein [Streptomyces spirodelae]MBO8188806.1 hypothetical protein [Streptomyces spirodelae]